METYSVELEKKFNFAAAHFVAYKGFRENLHGHNYKVSIKITARKLNEKNNYVIDFGEIRDILPMICKSLKGVLLIPKYNPINILTQDQTTTTVKCEDGSVFTFPNQDVKIIETVQITAECLAKYVTDRFLEEKEKSTPGWMKEIQLIKFRTKIHEDEGKVGMYSFYPKLD
jgi:6-pyruvoyl-tetrahydropterin synthase